MEKENRNAIQSIFNKILQEEKHKLTNKIIESVSELDLFDRLNKISLTDSVSQKKVEIDYLKEILFSKIRSANYYDIYTPDTLIEAIDKSVNQEEFYRSIVVANASINNEPHKVGKQALDEYKKTFDR